MTLYSVNILGDYENQNNPNSFDESVDLFDYTSEINFVGISNGRLMFAKNVTKSSPYNIEPEKPIG